MFSRFIIRKRASKQIHFREFFTRHAYDDRLHFPDALEISRCTESSGPQHFLNCRAGDMFDVGFSRIQRLALFRIDVDPCYHRAAARKLQR